MERNQNKPKSDSHTKKTFYAILDEIPFVGKAMHKTVASKEGFMKKLLAYFIILLFAIGFAFMGYLINNVQQIIQEHHTKQEIRSFFNSVDSEILQKIDAGQKEIPVLISISKERELAALTTYSNFYNFLYVQKSDDDGYVVESNELPSKKSGPQIIDLRPTHYRYYLYPKDNLVK